MRHTKFQLQTYWDENHECYIKKATHESKKHLQEMFEIHEVVKREFAENMKIQIVKPQQISELEL